MATWAPAKPDESWGTGKPDESWGAPIGFEGGTDVVNNDDAYGSVDPYGAVDAYATAPAAEEERSKAARLGRKDLEGLQTDRQNEKEKFISIWVRGPSTRDGKPGPLIELIPKFPRGAAKVFSEVWKKQLEGSGSSLIIESSYVHGVYTDPLKRILEWIELCIEEGNDVKFPEIVDENPLTLVIDIILLANKLKIPEMSLQAHLKKAAIKYARKSLIDTEHIVLIHDETADEYLGESEPLREAAAASVFEAWWSRVLDEPEYDEYCSYLEQLRVKFPKLDEDINKRFDDKQEYIKKKREEKRQARVNGGVDGGPHKNDGFQASSVADYPEATGPDGGWGDATATAAVTDARVDEWGAVGGRTAEADQPVSVW